MSPTPSLLVPAPPFFVSDVRRLQFLPRGRRRPGLSLGGLGWEPVRTRMISSSFIGIRTTSRRSVICASLFGVGAPEALVIGVVALLVFGPKGLAEVARNLGKTLRAFQPTIRELQDVSREFRSTLEREIGIDENVNSILELNLMVCDSIWKIKKNAHRLLAVNIVTKNYVKPETTPYTSEELMKVTEEQLAASAAAAWNTQPTAQSQQQEATPTSQSNDAAPSGGNDGPTAAAETEPDSRQPIQPEKAKTER
ncbi:hypothetical protein EJB05_38306 [Eragrostis curvula]|uniref:Sec-independent protein translocase protein TATB, chloroplastic n=1 Tax=Eragrostis curvula TaxID=38414 RepID=A0A5J9TTU9_9POAL|nr:hypothetical protein EJB05_38306 [Eragrostis curvula]